MIKLLQEAINLTQNGHFDEAEKIYQKLLEKFPQNYILLSAFGLFYVNIRNFEKATAMLKRACSIQESLGTLSALGFAEFEQRNWDEAILYLEKSLDYGESAEIYYKLILSLFELKHYKKAVELADKMYELYPEDINAITSKIKALTQSGKLFEAENFCKEALKKQPQSSSLWFHMGYLQELIYSNDHKARECFKAAYELGNTHALYDIAVSYQKVGELDKAEKYYNQMLQLYPNDIDTKTSLGMCLLTQKKFKAGYELFFQRDKSVLNKRTERPWKVGEEIEQKVVIICDQGFGDHIQFIRYLPFLGDRDICVAAPKALKDLFSENYPKFQFIDYDAIDPQMQSLRVTDLPYILNIDFEHIPFADGYLYAEAVNIKNDKLKVGLCWEAGSAGIRTMINRTIHVKLFEPIFNLNNIQLYSFQYNDTFGGNEKYPQMVNLAKDFKNFSDTAKALKAMDVVVTVDTSVAHLAAALGVKTYLLLPYASDWRWFRDTKITPWYTSVEIFKQVESISWEKPINDIVEKLQEVNVRNRKKI